MRQMIELPPEVKSLMADIFLDFSTFFFSFKFFVSHERENKLYFFYAESESNGKWFQVKSTDFSQFMK